MEITKSSTTNRRTVLWAAAGALGSLGAARAEIWPGFRGPRGDGTSLEKGLPLRWSGTENVAWKVPVPGRGHASPVVWGDRIYLVTCLEEREERVLLCLDRRSGKTLWQRTVLKAPLEGIHKLNSYASSTPLTDGERVYVSFLDREQMYLAAYDPQGNRQWEARPGPFSSKHGYSSSPILYKELLIVNGDHDGDSYLVALDRRSGRTVWKHPRVHKTRSYCTPIIREIDGRPQMLLSGSKSVVSIDPRDGSSQWTMEGPTEQFVAGPSYDGKLLFITAGYPDRHILAINPRGNGVKAEESIVWRTRRGCAYVPSPVVDGRFLYVVSDGGFASCFEAATGEHHWLERLEGGHSAALVAAEGRIYFQSDRGVTTVVKSGSTFQKLAANDLGEETYATPVISQGQLFLRGVTHLYALGKRR